MRPLLAYTIEDTSKLQYPVTCSVKLDGIRCLIIDGVVMSRSLKPIRNKHVQKLFGHADYNGLDGELIVGPANSPTVYRDTNSGVMSEEGEPDVKLYLFDRFDVPSAPFNERHARIPRNLPNTVVLDQHYVACEKTLLDFEEMVLAQGYEGVMLRNNGIYKFGRSTAREGILGKLKRFVDTEFEVIDFVERMHNANEAKVNALGHTERSMHKENMIGRGDLGALVCKCDAGTFNVGSGFTDADRAEIWNNRDNYIGKLAKVKSFLIGVKDLPRFPVFLGFRDGDDQ